MSTKKFLITLFAVIFGFAIVFSLVKVFKPSKVELSNYEEYAEYINAFTSGYISRNSEIIVEFNHNLNLNKQMDENQLQEMLSFSPSINGKVYWKDEYTLAFRPEKPMPYEQEYIATLKIKNLIADENKLNNFVFSFFIIPQTFSIDDYAIKTISSDYSLEKITAVLSLSDYETEENIKSCVQIKLNGNHYPYTLNTNDQLTYNIVIDSVPRTLNASSIEIICDGSSLGLNTSISKKIEIPALNDFKIIDCIVHKYPEQNMTLIFSDPIDNRQDLGGLITLNQDQILRFTIDGNMVNIYPSQTLIGDYVLKIYEGILNTKNKKTTESREFPITFEDIKPQVKFADNGFIIPTNQNGSIVPFITMNLKEIDVRIIQIYDNNVLQFLQTNDYNGNSELQRVGKIIYKGTLKLNITTNERNVWKRFYLDISKYVKTQPGAIYRVSLGFRQNQTLYQCNQNIEDNKNIDNSFDYFDTYNDYYDYYYDEDYDYNDYWSNRENPCHKAYYGSHHCVSKNVFASDIALIAKLSPSNQLTVFAANILSAEPMSGVEVELFNYPKQSIAKGTTDNEGKITFDLKEEASFITASKDNMKAYLKLNHELSLSTASFDVSGESYSNGLKGYIYGERGVWRPGDSLYLTFMLQEGLNPLPNKQPIIFEFFDPMHNLIKKQLFKKNEANIYTFRTATTADAVTGNYSINVKIGAAEFTKIISIETIKPNRLKIMLNSTSNILNPDENTTLSLHSEWLHGAPASGLKAQVDGALYPITTTFKSFKNFIFDDPTKKYYPQQENIISKELDENGNISFSPRFTVTNDAPGMMKAVFTTKVFEKGGEFSIDQSSFTYCPYKSFVGISVPEGSKDYGILYTDKVYPIQIVTVKPNGQLLQESHRIDCRLYKLDWRWWWDQSDEYFNLNYNAQSYLKLAASDTLYTNNGHLEWKINVNKNDWGRYLIVFQDLESNHSSGKIIYIDWPDWRSRQSSEHEQASTQLIFTSDKEKYNVNDNVTISFPGSQNGRALISLENSKGMVDYKWVSTVAGVNTYQFKATADMSPNIYVHITLIQPYNKQDNDKPIRLYGIQRINVENPKSHLTPVIDMPNSIKAENSYTVKVSEKEGKEMDYTLALVDEGLLSLTHFRTPDPWATFYAKEAYLFTQWDLYDYIIQGLAGKLMNIISIGGDEALKEAMDAIEAQKAKRFKPMVIFMGPCHLKSGSTNSHKIDIPNYMGEVRVMVVARHDIAYGNAEKSVKVIKPLMVMPSLPRVLSTEDKLTMPVAVFSNDKNLQKAQVTVKVTGPVSISGKNNQEITLKFNGDKTIYFDLVAQKTSGMATIEVTAVSGAEKSNTTTQIYVRNPNPFTSESNGYLVEGGKSLMIPIAPLGINGTNFTTLEISAIPSLNLEKHIDYLIGYPHGCLEQTVSKAFPQLYLATLSDIPPQKSKEIETNIKIALQKMQKFQTYQGGFAYWPGEQNIDDWVSSYAGHFLVEAQKAGYTLPAGMLNKWKNYQRQAAEKWMDKGPSSQYIQAYRLLTLALAGQNETGAMNRLLQSKNLSDYARYPLAAAYAYNGKNKIAEQLLTSSKPVYTRYMFEDIYGSDMREKALVAITYSTMNKRKEAFITIKELAKMLSSNSWYSTQSLSFAFVACANYLQGEKLRTPMKINYSIDNKSQTAESFKYFKSIPIDNANIKHSCNLQNNSSFPIYAQVIRKGILPTESEKAFEKGLSLNINYTAYNGGVLDISDINQTTDMYAVVQVTNNTAEYQSRLALTYTVPSGWEILNDRMVETATNENTYTYEYKDIRDDKVMYYFGLAPHQTKTFKVPVNATFAGKFYHPAVYCEAMYRDDIRAQLKGYWIDVKASK